MTSLGWLFHMFVLCDETVYLISLYSDPVEALSCQPGVMNYVICHELCHMARAVAINRLGVALLDRFYLINNVQ